MERKNEPSNAVNMFLAIGLGLIGSYFVVNRFFWSVSRILSSLWLIIGAICTLIGICQEVKKFRR